ncbi:MAG: outer membrane beta-barrel protein [Elusimicrobiota bacterium]
MTRIATVVLAAALLAPRSALGAGLDAVTQYKKGNIKIGVLALNPYAGVTETYDSNIYLRPKVTETGDKSVIGSWLTEANAGLKFKLPVTSMHQFAGGYDFVGQIYDKDPSHNNGVNQKADLAYMYKGPAGFSAKLSDAFMNTVDPGSSELVDRERRWQNTAGGMFDYAPEGGMFFFSGSGEHVTHKYLSAPMSALLNRYEQTFGAKTGYRLQPKTRLYVGYRRQIIHYNSGAYNTTLARYVPNDRNNKAHLIDVGIEGDIAPKLKGQIQTGYSLREYDDSNAGRTSISRNWIVSTNLTFNPVERVEAKLGFTRALKEAATGPRFYINNNVSFDYKHKLPGKVTFLAGVVWGIDKYADAVTAGGMTSCRRDDLYQQRAGLDYDIQEWVKVGAAYQHRSRHSIFTRQYNYDDHQTSVSLKLSF